MAQVEADLERAFPTADVLGTMTGVLLGEMAGIYRISEFMAGEPVWTHQLPRVGREICTAVLRQHPHLTPVVAEAEATTGDNWQIVLAGWIERFGATISLRPMGSDEHERIDAVSELVEKIGPDRVTLVQP